jgi:hypothetical protein
MQHKQRRPDRVTPVEVVEPDTAGLEEPVFWKGRFVYLDPGGPGGI